MAVKSKKERRAKKRKEIRKRQKAKKWGFKLPGEYKIWLRLLEPVRDFFHASSRIS